MDTIMGVKTVVAVVETGSFTAAAQRLSLSKALVSKYIGQVESELGVRLFNRTTRQLALTQAGQDYYQQALQLLNQYQQLTNSVKQNQRQPRGKLCMTTSVTFGDTVLAPLLCQFNQQYPDVTLQLILTDNKVDLVAKGIDLAIRIGHLSDSSLIAKKIHQLPLILCASPHYLSQAPEITNVSDLTKHNCLVDSNHHNGHQWQFMDKQSEKHQINVMGNMAINSPRSLCRLALDGMGVALLPAFLAKAYLNTGELVKLLDDYQPPQFGLYALYPHRQYLPETVQCMIEFLQQQLASSASPLAL
ncbi:LysR family transcriptional regulator [Motilimonas sp. KMU-193]|uniref:LysR family transcriptional regulator n=1 Tax=Motilimonas sp. KMU-193 TaxID=3388668 RepID=UPI00396B2887